MIKARTSIQNRLVLFLSVAIISLFGLSALGLFFFLRHAFYQQVDRSLIDIAEDFIHETGRTSDGELECEFHELNLEKFRERGGEGAAYYELRDHLGQILIRSASLAKSDKLPHHPLEIGQLDTEAITLPGNVSGRAVFTSFSLELEHEDSEVPNDTLEKTPQPANEDSFIKSYDKNSPTNRVYLTIAEDPVDLRQTLFILAAALVLTGIILAGTTFLLIRKIVSRTLLPIVEIAQITEAMGPDNLQSPLPENEVPAELLPLISKFNQFIQRLDDAISRERRFSMGLAHELRTPVAEIRSLMEVAADSEGSANEEKPHEIYQRGASISSRLSQIIEVISAIHQDNPDTLQLTAESISIESILNESIRSFAPQNQARFCFESTDPECTPINTDPALLRAIIDNLLTNATVHSPSKSPITISCQPKGFTVRNATQILRESDLPLFNEAFWQKDSARTDSERFGLGLTLVAVYLRLLNGRIEHRLEGEELTTSVIFLG